VGFLELVYVLGALGAKELDTIDAERSFVWRLLDLEDAGKLSRVRLSTLTVATYIATLPVQGASYMYRRRCQSFLLLLVNSELFPLPQTETAQRLKNILKNVRVRNLNPQAVFVFVIVFTPDGHLRLSLIHPGC
jgi:hypothetical protein